MYQSGTIIHPNGKLVLDKLEHRVYNSGAVDEPQGGKQEMTPKEAMAARGLRQDWVAKMMGISTPYLSQLVQEQRRWTAPLCHLFCIAVGVPASVLCFASAGTSREPERPSPRATDKEDPA